jgi:hypothetical protein
MIIFKAVQEVVASHGLTGVHAQILESGYLDVCIELVEELLERLMNNELPRFQETNANEAKAKEKVR